MTENTVKLRLDDVKRLVAWAEQLGPRNISIEIKVTTTNIGPKIVALAETDEGEGVWKDITDYDSW